jgi:hypothetical protein
VAGVTVAGATPVTDEGTDYIRGAGGVTVDNRRVLVVVVGSCLAILAAVAVALGIAAVDQNSRNTNLKQRGVAVDVSVTSCIGVLSGTGVTVASFNCRGTFTLGGHTYTDTIRGSTAPLATGAIVKAIADPHNPSVLSTTQSVAAAHPSWRAFILPAVLLVLAVGGAAGLLGYVRRGRRVTAAAA